MRRSDHRRGRPLDCPHRNDEHSDYEHRAYPSRARLRRYRTGVGLAVLLAAWHWSTPASAQGRREWALSLGPQIGYGSVTQWMKGTVEGPGQFTMVDADGRITGVTFGVSAALTKRFWWDGHGTGWGPIVALSYAYAGDTQATIEVTDEREQAAADRVAEGLHPRFMRFLLQGGVGLTLLGGLLEGRLLLGGELMNTLVPEFEAAAYDGSAALAANLGVRLRLPLTEIWQPYAGVQCGVSKHPLVTSHSTSHSTSCTGELGLEWVIGR